MQQIIMLPFDVGVHQVVNATGVAESFV